MVNPSNPWAPIVRPYEERLAALQQEPTGHRTHEIEAPGPDRVARDAGRGQATLAVPPRAMPRVREAKEGRQASETRLIPTGVPAVSSFAQD